MKIIKCVTKDQLVDHYLIRKIVFIDEQKVSYEDEFDLTDKERTAFLLYLDEKPVATARIHFKDEYSKIERIAVLKEYRNRRAGSIIVNHMIEYAKEKGYKSVLVGAQVGALEFYEKLGFIKYGDSYLDANIVHYNMKKNLS